MVLSPTGASRSLAAVFTPIKSRGLVDEVCGRIEQAVETGLLTSGQRLPNETELAAALGVSAVTAREALSQLRASGIIRTARGRSGGSFIADDVLPSRERALAQLHELSRLQIRDLALHYQAIAAACAGVAARRSDAADIATLRSFIPAADDDSAELASGPLGVPAGSRGHCPLGPACPGAHPAAGRSRHPHAAALRRHRLPRTHRRASSRRWRPPSRPTSRRPRKRGSRPSSPPPPTGC